MASRILGMGDMMTLIEKAQQDFDEKKSEELARKMKENSFDFNDFIEQLDQVMGMGQIGGSFENDSWNESSSWYRKCQS